MQLIIAVLLVRFIISLLENKNEKRVSRDNTVNRVVHPAEFEIR